MDIMKYAEFYCVKDCLALMQGMQSFNKDLRQIFSENDTQIMSVHQFLSISSIGYAFAIQYGCLDGVYAISGKPQDFIQRCVNGGRCMLAENKKVIIKDKIQDFDAVSLYPSAMSVMDGIPLGKPKILDPNIKHDESEGRHMHNGIDLMKLDQFFIEIQITKLNSKNIASEGLQNDYKFPLVFKTNGKKLYVNEPINKFYVDKLSLMYLEEFYDIEYKVKRGYYFNEGFNTKINEFVKKLFELRLKYKSLNNPLEVTIKLLLNSIYGKSIMKSVETDNIVVEKTKLDKYVKRYYNYIVRISSNANSDKAFVKRVKSINEHFNVPQFGVSVLSWSKYLMNRVICTAEQNNIDIYYTDTDSIHIKETDIDKLAEVYKLKYNKDLIGKQLTQYHTDFEPINGKPSFSTCFIGLGKKSYLGVLENEDGDKAYHIRMKSIPEIVLKNYATKNNMTITELYEYMYNGNEVAFNLVEGCNCFKKTSDYTQITLNKFIRRIKF
jgi:hypothetical protein